jgi:hypothetical protein
VSDKLERTLDTAWDVVNVVIAAGLLALVAWAWSDYGGSVGRMLLFLLLAAYFVGRWHTSRAWARDFAALHRLYQRSIDRELWLGGERGRRKP